MGRADPGVAGDPFSSGCVAYIGGLSMNRIETKIIIMVTNRLAAAKDSDAKTEMIEELSENLYQRFLELTEGGMSEEEALQHALESLGDVEELLAYLREAEKEEASERANDVQDFQEKEFSREEGSSFFKDDLENGIEEIVNAALSTAKVAVDCAKDVAKDVSDQLKERYPEGVFKQFTVRKGKKVDCTAVPPESVHSLEIRLTNGNVTIECTEEEDAFIEVEGDTEEIETMLKDDGVLSISQGNTASAAYFFMRGMRRSDLVVGLPARMWNYVDISTVNGDITIDEGLRCGQLKATTTSGDLELNRICCNRIELRSTSGDIQGHDLDGVLRAETKSGDIELEGTCGRCELFSASGNVCFTGQSKEMSCTSTSGDVELNLKNLPEKIKGSSISGDCEIRVPTEYGFRISYKTVSGKFMTNLPLAGGLGERSGEAVFGDGSRGDIHFSSVSGDVHVWAADSCD